MPLSACNHLKDEVAEVGFCTLTATTRCSDSQKTTRYCALT